MEKSGLIQIYTGSSGQINFFSPFGLAFRAAGHGFRSLITCFADYGFMKAGNEVSSRLSPRLVIDHSPVAGLHPGEEVIADRALVAFERASEAARAGVFDIVVLSGITHLIHHGLIGLEDVVTLMRKKDDRVELVLSGSHVDEDILDRADLVTEMRVSGEERPQAEGGPKNPGAIEVVTGHGKGKTTYCLGKAMLISSLGIPSFILQSIKSPKAYGEVMAIERLPNLAIKSMGEGFLNGNRNGLEKKHKAAARAAWAKSLREIFSLKYGLIVLDEINVATHRGLVRGERVKEMLFLKPENLHLMLSGRYAYPEVVRASTKVIEMKKIKHPLSRGIKARKGIEF